MAAMFSRMRVSAQWSYFVIHRAIARLLDRPSPHTEYLYLRVRKGYTQLPGHYNGSSRRWATPHRSIQANPDARHLHILAQVHHLARPDGSESTTSGNFGDQAQSLSIEAMFPVLC